MRIYPVLLGLALSLVVSCAKLPVINPDSRFNPQPCLELFPEGQWQLYHSIRATLPDGQNQMLTGVSVLSSRHRSVRCALMTMEGFVLFSGHYDGDLIIHRAVAPFNKPGFSRGLIDDLLLLFFAPSFPMQSAGRLKNGSGVCRYSGKNEGTVDIMNGGNHRWVLHQYAPNASIQRSIEFLDIMEIENKPAVTTLLAKRMILRRHGMIGYKLDLTLIEAIPLND